MASSGASAAPASVGCPQGRVRSRRRRRRRSWRHLPRRTWRPRRRPSFARPPRPPRRPRRRRSHRRSAPPSVTPPFSPSRSRVARPRSRGAFVVAGPGFPVACGVRADFAALAARQVERRRVGKVGRAGREGRAAAVVGHAFRRDPCRCSAPWSVSRTATLGPNVRGIRHARVTFVGAAVRVGVARLHAHRAAEARGGGIVAVAAAGDARGELDARRIVGAAIRAADDRAVSVRLERVADAVALNRAIGRQRAVVADGGRATGGAQAEERREAAGGEPGRERRPGGGLGGLRSLPCSDRATLSLRSRCKASARTRGVLFPPR